MLVALEGRERHTVQDTHTHRCIQYEGETLLERQTEKHRDTQRCLAGDRKRQGCPVRVKHDA